MFWVPANIHVIGFLGLFLTFSAILEARNDML